MCPGGDTVHALGATPDEQAVPLLGLRDAAYTRPPVYGSRMIRPYLRGVRHPITRSTGCNPSVLRGVVVAGLNGSARHVLARHVANTLDHGFCLERLWRSGTYEDVSLRGYTMRAE